MVEFFFNNINITNHAYRRIMSDRFSQTKPKNKKEAKSMIRKALSNSVLLKLNKDGTELRVHNGKIYVCSVNGDGMTVITVLKGNSFVA